MSLPATYHEAISAKRRDELEDFETAADDQLVIGVAGDQRTLEGFDFPAKPAPVSFERDAGAEEELESRRTVAEDDRRARGVVLFNGEEISREAYDRIRGVAPAEELEESPTLPTDEPDDWEDSEYDAASRPEHPDYRCPECGFGPRATPEASHAPDCSKQPAPKKSSSTKRTYSCGSCGKTLKNERWIFSRHTGSRYCWPGECRGEKKGR